MFALVRARRLRFASSVVINGRSKGVARASALPLPSACSIFLLRRRRSLWIALAPANRSIAMVFLFPRQASPPKLPAARAQFVPNTHLVFLHSRHRSSSFSSRCAIPRVLLGASSSSFCPASPPAFESAARLSSRPIRRCCGFFLRFVLRPVCSCSLRGCFFLLFDLVVYLPILFPSVCIYSVCVFDSIAFRDPALSTASSSLLPPPHPPPRIFRLRAIKSSKTESKEGRQQANGHPTLGHSVGRALRAWAVISAGLVPRRHHSLLRPQE